jgi:quinol monooxygenase YgiN
MKILVAGVIEFDPDKREQALTGAKALIEGALAERGCIAYSWTADLNSPGRVQVFEEWTDEAALAEHLAGPWYHGMLEHLQRTGILSAVTTKYRCDRSQPGYDASGVPRADFFDE